MDIGEFLNSGFFGAIIGGTGTLWAARMEIKSSQRKEKISDIEKFIRISTAVHAEFKCLWRMFHAKLGQEIESSREFPNEILNFTFKIDCDYFPIYRNNTSFLGEFHEKNSIDNIIGLYINASALIDSLRLYTEEMNSYISILSYIEDNTKNKHIAESKRNSLLYLKKYIILLYDVINGMVEVSLYGIEKEIKYSRERLSKLMK